MRLIKRGGEINDVGSAVRTEPSRAPCAVAIRVTLLTERSMLRPATEKYLTTAPSTMGRNAEYPKLPRTVCFARLSCGPCLTFGAPPPCCRLRQSSHTRASPRLRVPCRSILLGPTLQDCLMKEPSSEHRHEWNAYTACAGRLPKQGHVTWIASRNLQCSREPAAPHLIQNAQIPARGVVLSSGEPKVFSHPYFRGGLLSNSHAHHLQDLSGLPSEP
jgi:hypothetical protein